MELVKKPKKTKSGQYSTSEETLQKIRGEHKVIEHILDYREIKKLLSTYVNALPIIAILKPIEFTLHLINLLLLQVD